MEIRKYCSANCAEMAALTNFVMEREIRLCPIAAEDQMVMLEILTSDIVNKTYMLPDFEKKEDAIPLFRRIMKQSREETHFVRGIYANGELVGFLNDVEEDDGVVELGYAIHPAHHGRGYATAALKAAIAALLEKGYREVVCGAFAENTASIRCMEKAGMERLPKTEEIEYRGKMHHCIYYSRSDLRLVTPALSEMDFRRAMLADPETMSYNHAYGGTIEFPETRWPGWYQKWVSGNDPSYFYRYLYSERLAAFVGEAAYHYEPESGRFLCDIIVHACYRGHGFGKMGLALLCAAAAENGIQELYDDILLDNPSISLFLKSGFEEIERSKETYIVRKRLR